jgi:hypothetical protein
MLSSILSLSAKVMPSPANALPDRIKTLGAGQFTNFPGLLMANGR